MKTRKTKTKVTAANLDAKFDAGEDLSAHFDFKNFKRINHTKSRVNVDIPVWMIQKLDRVAGRNGIARQALIKIWLAERLKTEDALAA
jgi:hypothetical protein